MKNTTISSVLNFGKDSKRWLSGYLVLFTLMSVTTVFAQTGTINIGTGTSTNGLIPINSCYNYNYSQQIVKATNYAAGGGVAGQITKVRYYYASGGTTLGNWNNWTVYLGHTTKTEFTSNTDWEPVANLTQVYSGAITPVAGNWFEITFTTPFSYNGTSNLIIAVDENVPNYSCTANFGSFTSTANAGIYYFSDGTNPDPAAPPTGTRTANVARLQFFGDVASCLAPTGLTSSGVGANTATVSWTADASAANGYQYYSSTTNTPPDSSTTPSGSVGAGITTAALSGFASNTPYYVWVRSVCSGVDVSAWSPSVFFTTLCDAADIPYSQDANAVSTPAMPSCITTQNAGTGNNWTTATNPGYGFSSNVFRYSYNSSNAANAWFYTQGLNLTAGVSYRLSYKYGNNSTFYTEKLKVGYGTSASAAGMTTILADHSTVTGASAVDTFVDFTPTTTGVYYIGFNAYSIANQFYLYVDDISVTVTPTCEPVTGVVATTASFTSGNLVWNESASSPTDGYDYYISTDATAPTDATTPSNSVAAGVTEAELTGLTINTTYHVWVRAVCSDSDSSPWEGPSSFYTGYCTPAPTSVDAQGIVNVNMGTISNPSGGEPGNYANYTAQSTDAAVGATVNFAITYQTGYTYGTKIWIDWNNDADFDDAGELVYTGLSTNANPTTLSGSFNVPVDAAVVGSHTVRIGGTDNDAGGTPCYSSAYGSYEDYTINIFMPDPPAITGFTPSTYCAVSGDITITGTSLGNATLEIGGTAVDITTNSDTEIVASVPAGVSGIVSVTTVAGTATTVDTFAVTEPAELALSGTEVTICLGDSSGTVTITEGAADFDIYEWSPATGVTGNAADGYVFNPSETTTYTLTASQSAGSCVIATEYVVTVNPVPTPITVIPANTNACLGSPVELTAEGGETITAVDYCVPTVLNTGTSGDFINNFSFANVTNNASGDTAADYIYYSALTANVVGGQTYNISLQSGSAWGQRFRVWIDFNQDGIFSASESIFDTTTATTAAVNGTVTIPASAFNGNTRMRVGCRYGSTGITATEACGHAGFGEWEDYNVVITGASSAVEYVWSPIDGLYEDAAGTVAYTGDPAQVVYAMPSANTTYTATVTTDLGCPASDSATINVIVTPAPTGDTEASFTTAATVADLTATGTDIHWYNVATGGTPLTSATILSSGMYYATQTLNGCESQDRLAVTVTVPQMDWVNLQWPPQLTIVQGNTGIVYAQGYEPGVTPGAGPGIGVTAWIGISDQNTDPSTWTTWIPMTFNVQVGNNDEFMAAIGDNLEPGTYYYASRFQYQQGPYSYGGYSAGGGSIWNGTDFVSGMLTVNCGTTAPVAAASQAFCDAVTVADLVAEGDNVQWYATATGGSPLAMSAAVVSGGTYYASQTVGCESLTRTAVAVTVNVTPAPTGSAAQVFEDGATVADLMAMGSNIMWYSVATGGTMLNADAALVNGATYYASQTMNGCESQNRLAVTVTVNPPSLDYVNLQYPGSLTVVQGNTGVVYAQAYEAGVTPGTGPGAGITAWVGVNADNTDPSTWTTWIPMTFNIQVGNNDEYMAAIGAGLEPGTYYYASRFQLEDGPYSYGGYNTLGGNFWDGAMYISGVLTVVCNTQAPMASAEQSFCNSATVADLAAEGEMVQWYDAAEGGMPLAEDTELMSGMTYYASQTMDCESIERTAVAVMVYSTETPTVPDAVQVVCSGATVADLFAAGSDLMWYEAADGGEPLAMDAEVVNGTIYYGSQTMNGCESLERVALTVEVTVTPAPTGETSQVVVAGSNTAEFAVIEDIVVNGNDVVWYMTEEDAMAGTNPIAPGTVIEEGMTYYAVQTIGGCTSVNVLAVTVTKVLGGTRFDAASFSYYPNPVKDVLTIQYSSDITSVAVFNMLGQQVMAKTPNTTDVKLDMSILADGTYIVTINADTMTKTIKVVKKQ
ncbi:T9SS type A sorting domain-containing protein [Flavobacterium sp. LaA7.5]|nr:T9SS type A sorting domain-containing protein [Flavobacterium salilacus subsp. altitudinum]